MLLSSGSDITSDILVTVSESIALFVIISDAVLTDSEPVTVFAAVSETEEAASVSALSVSADAVIVLLTSATLTIYIIYNLYCNCSITPKRMSSKLSTSYMSP